MRLNTNFPLREAVYAKYKKGINFHTDKAILNHLGAGYNEKFNHSHILDLLNSNHC